MQRTRSVGRPAFVFLVALQLSCGGDSSGPGNVATTMSANSATSISSPPGSQVSDRPSVVVFDQTGDPMSGVAVTFAVSGGGGTVTGGSQVTNAQGVATVGGWTLGTAVGSYTLVASAANLQSITFTASTVDPCIGITALALGATASGSLTTADCRLSDGSFIDFFATTVSAAGTYLFTQTSTAFDTFIALFGSTGALIGLNDDVGNTSNSAIKAILPPGSFEVGATSLEGGETGSYTVSFAASTAGITNCEDVFLVRGSNTAQQLQTTDCLLPSGGRADDYFIFLEANQPITVTMASSAFNTYLELWSTPTTRVAFNDDNGTSTDSRMTFTPTETNLYLLRATSPTVSASGAYTLVVE